MLVILLVVRAAVSAAESECAQVDWPPDSEVCRPLRHWEEKRVQRDCPAACCDVYSKTFCKDRYHDAKMEAAWAAAFATGKPVCVGDSSGDSSSVRWGARTYNADLEKAFSSIGRTECFCNRICLAAVQAMRENPHMATDILRTSEARVLLEHYMRAR